MNDFQGFEPANTTPVPDVLFDVLLPHLNEAQLKVLLYVVRRTLGFKKTADAISLKQFRYGITTKKGEQLDSGCGLKNFTSIIKALKSLEEMGCIESEKKETTDGDQATTVYRILFRGTAPNGVPVARNAVPTVPNGGRVLRQTEDGTAPNGGRVLRQTESQETVLQETVLQETVNKCVSEVAKSLGTKKTSQDTSTHTQNKIATQTSLPEIKPTIPEMPTDNAPWPSPEVAVQIVEAKLGKHYSETARAKQLSFAKRMFKEDPALTREQFVAAYDKRNDDWWSEHKGLLHLHHMVEKDRIHEMLDKILAGERRKNGSKVTANKPAQITNKASMTHDDAIQLATDAMARGKQHGYDIKANATSDKNDAWVVSILWDGNKIPAITSRTHWESEFAELHDLAQWEIARKQKGAK